MDIPKELYDPKTGIRAKGAARLSVGRASENRVVLVSFDDHGAVYMMSPDIARKLAQELVDEANALSQ
jgi:tartrate dehydratase beta subunit/fumarate hydratase class I family protein